MTLGANLAFAALALCLPCVGSCSQHAAARGQLLVAVDSDARLVSELATRQDVSADATMDTLRIDVLDDKNDQYDLQTFIVSDPSSWPLSFGVAAGASGEIRLRFRLFRAQFASSDVVDGKATLTPPSQVTIDRLLLITPPASGVETVRIVLAEDCMGTPVSLGASPSTCIDGAHLQADAHGGAVPITGAVPPSVVESWGPAVDAPCVSTPGMNQVCIPGGFAILGDLNNVGLSNGGSQQYDPVPLRPVIVSPFLVDQYEFTIARLRALYASGFTDPEPMATEASDVTYKYCKWLGAGVATNDTFPVNCIPYPSATDACVAVHGQLLTEAQWEFMARGRGQRRSYPWGEAAPQCCTASVARPGPPPDAPLCQQGGAGGPEPVGSHQGGPACATGGDVSRDDVYDLAGSVTEALLDGFQAYDADCWASPAILHNPICTTSTVVSPSARGGNWYFTYDTTLSQVRTDWGTISEGQINFGFRCAYEDGQ